MRQQHAWLSGACHHGPPRRLGARSRHQWVVAHEADAIDPDTRLGRSVVVTAYAHLVTHAGELARIRRPLAPWAPRQGRACAARIRPGLVTGVRLGAPDGIPRDD
ncbi:hypothetical protein ACFZC3_08055 [Streptomyces sp. NPDC007903]|uniref:hypothetical protein n=1 Tax=Streptomyces sp. NPDC007903 TaxID=3364786 RepID=UPI0036E5A65E